VIKIRLLSCKMATVPILFVGFCMYLGGPGGTGKTKVIGAIVTLFDRIGYPEKLVL
jgi:tetraacyldisaccharide-1-P 4'-kinase